MSEGPGGSAPWRVEGGALAFFSPLTLLRVVAEEGFEGSEAGPKSMAGWSVDDDGTGTFAADWIASLRSQ
jgi:hypothetical protein